jgi:dipeptide/tripeptide permease
MFVPFMLSWLAPLVFITGAFVVFVAWLGSIKGVIIGSACLMLLMTNFHSLISMATSESEMNYYGALLIILGCGVVMLAGSYLKGKQYDNTDVRAYNRS